MNPFLRALAKREAKFKGHKLGEFKVVHNGRWEAECRHCGLLAVATPYGTPQLSGGAISLRCAKSGVLGRVLRAVFHRR